MLSLAHPHSSPHHERESDDDQFQGGAFPQRGHSYEGPLVRDPNPTLVSPAAKSCYVAVTGISAKEGSQFYVAVIDTKSMHGISTTSCQKG
jgi:hypothetical protein